MPVSMIVAVVALTLFLGLNLVNNLVLAAQDEQGPLRLLLSIGLSALLLTGFYVGHRLAWQWGRVLGLLAAAMFSLVLVLMFPGRGGDNLAAGFVLALYAACLWTIFFSLGTTSAKEYFRLRCPSCSQFTSTASDFFFTRARCKKCDTAW